MAKGAIAKENLIAKFIKANFDNYIGCFDKKYYFWSEENGDKVQIAITMTCPKVPVEAITSQANGKIDFENDTEQIAGPTGFEPQEVTDQEVDNIKEMMKRLGL